MQNLSFDLIKRKKYFSTVLKRLEGKNLLVDYGDLWAKLQISPANIYESLIHSVDRYLCETLNNSAIPCLEEMNSNASGISRFLSKPWHKVKDITPNGLIVPKHETIEAYGKILVSCVEIIETIVPEGHLKYIDGSPNVRFKSSFEPDCYNTARPTELPHLDVWAGTDINSLNLYIPLAGDVLRNSVELYSVPSCWTESWTKKQSYSDGSEIVALYSRSDISELERTFPSLGEALLWDSSVCHSTLRRPECEPRLSIDVHFTPERFRYASGSPVLESQDNQTNSKDGVLLFEDLNRFRLGQAELVAAAATGIVPSEVKGAHSAGITIIPRDLKKT